ncbi:unnamed protein product [Oncorhynchus mykiss]|uniref:Uncharacterized protein n=1 Tax=Oncorhynchus mykiss TaxID=8022 RepID=A0A060W4B9_ONCMY|nr:unnamed protein product [Oncorhynchus mykiss]
MTKRKQVFRVFGKCIKNKKQKYLNKYSDPLLLHLKLSSGASGFHCSSFILKWKKFGTTKTFPRADCPAKLSNWGKRALVRENLPEGQPSLQHSTNKAFMVEWQDVSHSSVKAHDSLLGVCQMSTKGLGLCIVSRHPPPPLLLYYYYSPFLIYTVTLTIPTCTYYLYILPQLA